MKSHLQYIAILDNNDKLHCVEFTTGVNVITGKSSTGKSAMIEIFDYCFGSSDDTVPAGVITEQAKLYFIIMSIGDTNLVLARSSKNKKGFLREETSLPDILNFNQAYFDDKYFLPMSDFRINLGHYFSLDINDTDTDLKDREYKRKSPRPSVRHFTSFMLQHQNLIANKHSLFYRFDEKEKREQTIDQFKIFTGFVTQGYFIKKQQLVDLERKLRKNESQQSVVVMAQKEKEGKLIALLNEYNVVTGGSLLEGLTEVALSDPANILNKITHHKVVVNINSDKYIVELDKLDQEKNRLLGVRRTKEIKLKEILSSVDYAKKHRDSIHNTTTAQEAAIHLSKCPFCSEKNENILKEANLLENAIVWLNDELSKTPLLLDSFSSNAEKIKAEIVEIQNTLTLVKQEICFVKKSATDLEKNKSLEEQALKIKLKIENILEERIGHNAVDLEGEIVISKEKIKNLKKEIKDKYNPVSKLESAERYINNAMSEIGENLDFEDSYGPINLKFSLDTFELWHEKEDGKKIFLRSMGSGANWLSCHIALFTSIQRYFCSLGNKALVPPILFLDQPSQVYFPVTIDTNKDKFDAKDLKSKEGKLERLDEDLSAVNILFDQLVDHCKKTTEETGITPQIIITDHADNLELKNADFESLVNGRRWRSRGFIQISDTST
mgnify:CR=1 FL=1